MARLRSEDAAARIENGFGPDYSEALARGLAVLTTFAHERRPLTLSDIARGVDLPRATTRRALHTLTHLGFAESDGKLFRLTPKVLTLAGSFLLSNQISMILQPACDALSAEFDETVSAAVLVGDEAVMIAHAAPRRMATAGVGVGFRIPAYCSALGRVLLAGLPDPALDRFLDQLKPLPLTARTITDKSRLRLEILQSQAEGHALVDQEAEAGFCSLAVPIDRYDGRTIAALNIGAPVERIGADARATTHLPRLRDMAKAIRSQLI